MGKGCPWVAPKAEKASLQYSDFYVFTSSRQKRARLIWSGPYKIKGQVVEPKPADGDRPKILHGDIPTQPVSRDPHVPHLPANSIKRSNRSQSALCSFKWTGATHTASGRPRNADGTVLFPFPADTNARS